MHFNICSYNNYTELPSILFDGHTPGYERKSLDGTKFVVRSTTEEGHSPSWMNGTEIALTHEEVLVELNKLGWTAEDG